MSEVLLTVLGPLSIGQLQTIARALPPSSTIRQSGTVTFDGAARAVFEFVAPAAGGPGDGTYSYTLSTSSGGGGGRSPQ